MWLCVSGKGIADDAPYPVYETIGSGFGTIKQRAKDLGGELRLQNARPSAIVQVIIPHQGVESAGILRLVPQSIISRPRLKELGRLAEWEAQTETSLQIAAQ